ncbi:putative tetratricopeptide-like helical domain superfamily [Helianthus debilis subsp. tardiflorus]
MMMRSSSTPVLGSLLSPENPNNHHHHADITTFHPYKISPIHKFSFNQTLSCNSSPISQAFRNNVGIRRAQSDGNLESLMSSRGNDNDNDNDNDGDFSFFDPPKKVSHRCLLETIPSMSFHNSRFRSDGDDESDEQEEEEEEEEEEEDEGFCGFNVENTVLSLNKQMGFGNLEMKGGGAGRGGRSLSRVGGEGDGGGGGDNQDVEEHYRKMVNECPGNPLLLGNYAQFLYQSKQDLKGAEEYYSRAILADPNDGEILSQYAKLLWELHHDKERATAYFERAIQVASEDSHVHAAYASFLWEAEGEEDEEEEGYYSNIPPLFNNGSMASAATV